MASNDSTTTSGERKTYTVNFHPDDETLVSGHMTSQKFIYGISQKLHANNYKKDGYYFIAWNTQSDGSGTSYSDQQIVMNLTEEDNGVVDLYPIWGRGTYTIKFYSNGGKGMMPDQEIRSGIDNNLNRNIFTRTGYTYVGWNTDSNATTGLTSLNMGVGNVTLYAIYSKTITATLYAFWAKAKVGSTYYTTLQNAINAISSGTVTLLNNTTESTNVGTGKNITIDLNGKTLTITSSYNCLYVTEKLTIKNGTVKGGSQHAVGVNGSGASLTIQSGTYTAGADYGVCASGASTLTITGGTFSGGSGKHGAGCSSSFTGTANISGGTFNGGTHGSNIVAQ